VAFLWSAGTSTPLVDSLLSAVPTNATSSGLNGGNYWVDTAWLDILTDPNFRFGTNSAGGAFGGLCVGSANSNGGITYQSGTPFQGMGLPPGGYSLFMVAWNNDNGTLLDPVSAAAAHAFVGWSGLYVYTATVNDVEAVFMQPGPFGIAGSMPEPGTLALLGAGGFAVTFFRRKKT
jgi:hypothetical protein